MKRAGIIAAGWGERLGQKTPKALTRIGKKALIDFVLDGMEAAGIGQVTCIVNESAGDVPRYVAASGRALQMDWIIQTTPSSMHSFLIVLERLASLDKGPFLMATVDSVCSHRAYATFLSSAAHFPDADLLLGLTDVIDDEKPLRVAMKGEAGTGIMPASIPENPEAFEIVGLTNVGFDSEYVTSGFYFAHPRILKEKEAALNGGFTALRQYLGHVLRYGYHIYGVPLPPVIDVDRPQDIRTAEKMLETL